MNRQNLDRKEVRLGMAQIVGILGLTIGSILAAFGLGFYSGRSAAFEKELSNALASLPKLPVNEQEGGADLGEKIVSEVYAKLNEQNDPQTGSAGESNSAEENSFPELGTIKEAETSNTELEKETEEITDVELENEEPEDLGSVAREAAQGKADNKPTAQPTSVPAVSAPTVSVPTVKPTVKPVETAKTPDKAAEKTLGESKQPKATPIVIHEKPKAEITIEPVVKPKEVSKPPTGWYAQIAAPKEISDANALASNLKKAGFPAVIETAEVRGEKYYRVIVGPELSKAQADVLLKQLKRESYITGDPFLRMVK